MKTLAQLKRDLQKGTIIKTIQNLAKTELEGLERVISYKDTTGIYLKGKNDTTNKRGSFLDYPKASELEYHADTFQINNGYNTLIYRIIK